MWWIDHGILFPSLLKSLSWSIENCLSIHIAIKGIAWVSISWSINRSHLRVCLSIIPYLSRLVKRCLSIDAINRSFDKKLLEYWNRSHAIAWVLKSIARDCLTIEIDRTWLLKYWNWLNAIAWVLKWIARDCLSIEMDRKRLLEYWNWSNVIAWLLESIARDCLSIEMDQTWLLGYWNELNGIAWVLKWIECDCLTIEMDWTGLLEYWNK